MAAIDDVWLAALTKDEDDAGSKNRFNLTVNIDGADVFGHDFLLGWNLPGQGGTGLRDGQAGLEEAKPPAPFDSDKLTNSSVRLGLRGDDAWAPKHVMVIGRAQPDFTPGRVLALAMETYIDRWLSADNDEGRLTMPVRRVGAGTSDTVIRRVLLLIGEGGSQLLARLDDGSVPHYYAHGSGGVAPPANASNTVDAGLRALQSLGDAYP